MRHPNREEHLHLHVVPRYDGDSIIVFPRLADPRLKDEIAQRLRTALDHPRPVIRGAAEKDQP
ncbi:hypothetical protein [Kitasatospora sp. NPDC088346]|uniref:hypothetical protein n=1 Tax=Kitasatospora sp. NPDC088346 TaxID=3364073 RepID=UPI00380B7358